MGMDVQQESAYDGKCIEITQDAAAFCRYDGNITGVFTQDIESCIIIVVEYEHGFLMIHDSGQLDLQTMINLVNSYGKTNKIEVIYGPNVHEQIRISQKERIKKLMKASHAKIKYSPTSEISFAILKEKNGTVSVIRSGSKPDNLFPLPDQEIRKRIVNFNNFFLPPRDQSLLIDIQFDGFQYINNTKAFYTADYVIKTIYEQINDRINGVDFFKENLKVVYPINLDYPSWFRDFLNANVIGGNGVVTGWSKNIIDMKKEYVSLFKMYEQ